MSMLRFLSVVMLTVALSAPAEAGGRPPHCPKRLWCGCWLAHYLGISGAKARHLWVARNWTRVGRPASGPAPGVIAVFARKGGGHVGIVKRVTSSNTVVLLSGNDGGAVRERERSVAGVIAWRSL